MHAFDVLGNPVRRRILELLAEGELTSGAIVDVVQEEFGITQPAVSAPSRAAGERLCHRARRGPAAGLLRGC